MFTHVIITQNTNHHNIMYLCRDHSVSTSLGKGELVDEESNKNDIETSACSQKSDVRQANVLFSVTQFFLLGFL